MPAEVSLSKNKHLLAQMTKKNLFLICEWSFFCPCEWSMWRIAGLRRAINCIFGRFFSLGDCPRWHRRCPLASRFVATASLFIVIIIIIHLLSNLFHRSWIRDIIVIIITTINIITTIIATISTTIIIIGAVQCTTGQSDFWPLFRENLIIDDWGAFPQYQSPPATLYLFSETKFQLSKTWQEIGKSVIWDDGEK